MLFDAPNCIGTKVSCYLQQINCLIKPLRVSIVHEVNFYEVKANNYLSINNNVPLFIILVPSSKIINGAQLNPKVSNLISSNPPTPPPPKPTFSLLNKEKL